MTADEGRQAAWVVLETLDNDAVKVTLRHTNATDVSILDEDDLEKWVMYGVNYLGFRGEGGVMVIPIIFEAPSPGH